LPFCLTNRMVRGADSARFLAECCGYDLNLVAHWPPLKSIQLFAQWIKQCRTRLSYTAADDNDLRVKGIYE